MNSIESICRTVKEQTELYGVRSDKRLKAAHDMIAEDILSINPELTIRHLSNKNNSEVVVKYGSFGESKKVDFAGFKNENLIFTGGTKFINSSYNKNSVNYCESEFAQAYLLSKNTPYFSINVIPTEIPLYNKQGELIGTEIPTKRNLYKDILEISNVYLGVYYIDKDFNLVYNTGYSYEDLIKKIGELTFG